MPGLRLRPNGDVPHLTMLATMPTVGRLSDFSLVECTPLKVRGQYGPRGAPDARVAAHNYTRGSTVRYNARSPRLDGQCGSDGPAPRCAELAWLVYGEVDHEEALSAGTADHAGAGPALLRNAWTTAAGRLGTASWAWPASWAWAGSASTTADNASVAAHVDGHYRPTAGARREAAEAHELH